MKDAYYYRSLIATLLAYCAVLAGIIYAVYRTGVIGFTVLLCIVSGALCYFYGVFEKSADRMKGNDRCD